MVYFDNAATTQLDQRVLRAMQKCERGIYGNPSSLHTLGKQARAAVERARAQVAALLGCEAAEIVFTGSGTESCNLALTGVFESLGSEPAHIIASSIEHPAVAKCCEYLQGRGAEVSWLPVSPEGIVSPEALAKALRPHTRLVSVMTASNELGTLQPIRELAAIARQAGALFHTDATQAAGKIPVRVKEWGIDLLSFSGHKLYGPKGVGGLYVRKGVMLNPVMHGGGQEHGLRSATENVPGIAGFGLACELAAAGMGKEAARLVGLRDAIIDSVSKTIPNVCLLGDRYRRLPGHICLRFAGQEGDGIGLLLKLNKAGFAVSSGSACSSNHSGGPSRVLLALGL
ncbi:MAG TPA: cysteine desulfurase family protein, partial [Elusimicrobiales bacterium]|nr:cysteine desulfurase family protein [Elusimicrobiales bacterium]